MIKTRILLVDDHVIVRQGLRALLEAETDLVIVGEADTGRQGVELAVKLKPDVVIMDIAMPALNGVEATRQVLEKVPTARVLVLSSYGDDEYVRQLIEGGAAGYLLKHTAAVELIKAVREVKNGNAFFSPAVSRRMVNQYRESFLGSRQRQPEFVRLTSREMEVLQLIAEGQTNKGIAFELNVSTKTVEKHRQQVMNKLNLHDVAGLTRYAMAKGIIQNQIRAPD